MPTFTDVRMMQASSTRRITSTDAPTVFGRSAMMEAASHGMCPRLAAKNQINVDLSSSKKGYISGERTPPSYTFEWAPCPECGGEIGEGMHADENADWSVPDLPAISARLRLTTIDRWWEMPYKANSQ